jgi:protein-disulfide isomerase
VSQKKDRETRRERLEAVQKDQRRKTTRRNLVISLSVIVAFAVVVGAVIAINAWTKDPESSAAGNPTSTSNSRLVRPDSHKLGAASDGKVTFVEFLDFECPSCGAIYPAVEQLRKQYAGKVTFVVRYFPLDMHFNAKRASNAVEAAAQQGKFEEMYQKMYETQQSWGNQQTPADATFRGFAESLGLDLAKWDKAYKDPATAKRIQEDVTDGQALGVSGTPTFFVNGEKLEPRSYEDFTKAIDAALAK